MKKYIEPTCKVVAINCASLLATSPTPDPDDPVLEEIEIEDPEEWIDGGA